MSEEEVLYETKDHVAHITLNRPHRLNAITLTMPRKIKELVERANWGMETKWKLIFKIETQKPLLKRSRCASYSALWSREYVLQWV